MEIFFNLINQPAVPWILALSIIALAIFVWVAFRRQINKFSQQLKSVQKILDTIPKQQFAQHYEEFCEKISHFNYLSHQWQAFQHTLILPKTANQPIYYTYRAGLYFNQTSLIAPQINLPLYQAVPNILVGIGLFFTFIGLIAALWFASEGVAADNVQQAKTALSDLLHAATFKFVTSVAGLMTSILFSWREKTQLHFLNEKLHHFCTSLEQRLEFTTLEQLTAQQVHESKRQTEQLERFNSELAVSVAHALEDQFSEKLLEAIQPLAGMIESLQDKISGMNQDALEKMVQSFTQSLQGAAGEELNRLAQNLNSLQPALANLSQQLTQSSGTFQQHIQQAAGQLQAGFEQGADTLIQHLSTAINDFHQHNSDALKRVHEPIQEVIASLNTLKTSIDESSFNLQRQLTNAAEHTAHTLTSASMDFGEQLNHATQTLTHIRSQLAQVLDDSVNTTNNVVQRIENLQNSFQTTEKNLRSATAPLAKTVEMLIKTIDQVDGLANAALTASKALTDSSATVETVWQKYQARFEGVDEDVAKVFHELSAGMENYRKQTENFTLRLDESLTKAVQTLSGMVGELVEAIEEANIATPPTTSRRNKKT